MEYLLRFTFGHFGMIYRAGCTAGRIRFSLAAALSVIPLRRLHRRRNTGAMDFFRFSSLSRWSRLRRFVCRKALLSFKFAERYFDVNLKGIPH